jgi:hypothetical protein
MRNNYDYIDPDYTYTDPKTGVLRNLADITDSDGLLFFESAAVIKRSKENCRDKQTRKAVLSITCYLYQNTTPTTN